MDPNTAFRHIALAEGGCKATLRTENQNPAEHAERFQFWRQVLCREPLGGSPFYWEVEWTGLKVYKGLKVSKGLKVYIRVLMFSMLEKWL